jgi:hypothetical protein
MVILHFSRGATPSLSSGKGSFNRSKAWCVLFFTLTQSGDRPARYGRSLRLDTSPSKPVLEAARIRSRPNAPISNRWMKGQPQGFVSRHGKL